MYEYFGVLGVVIGTFLPIIGAVLTVLLALILDGRARWIVLVALPMAVGVACWAIAAPVMYDGNLLAALFYILYFLALLVYYPALALVVVIRRIRARSASAGSSRPADIADQSTHRGTSSSNPGND